VKDPPWVLQASTRSCSRIRRLTRGEVLDFFRLMLSDALQFLRQVRIIARKHNAPFT
jgi:hypothetical protein